MCFGQVWFKIANPNYIRYLELRINQPDKNPDGQISPLILDFHSSNHIRNFTSKFCFSEINWK